MLVSIIIPMYNSVTTARDAIEAVAEQSYEPLELIVVNDGSTDSTATTVEKALDQYGVTARVLEQANAGAQAARNIGLAHARGTYVQYLDADDIIAPQKIARQVDIVHSSSAVVDVVAGAFVETRLDDTTHRVRYDVPTEPWEGLLTSHLGRTSSLLWRKEAIHEVGGWSPQQQSSQEYELLFRLLRRSYTIVSDPAFHTTVRKRPDSVSTGDGVTTLRRWLNLRVEMKAFLQEQGNDVYTHGSVQQSWHQMIGLLYADAPKDALRLHQLLIEPSYIPDAGRVYRWLYQMLGYAWAQRLAPYWYRWVEPAHGPTR